MSSYFEFNLEGLSELQADVEKCVKMYPEKMSAQIYSLSGRFTKDVNSKFPERYANGKRPLHKNWKREREKAMFTGYTVGVEVRNTAPHFHLVENGHVGKIPVSGYAAHIKSAKIGKAKNLYKSANKGTYQIRSIGFVPGKHYCEKTRNEWEDKFPTLIEEYTDKLLKEHNL